jgi:ATP-dependent RNA helicase HelY
VQLDNWYFVSDITHQRDRFLPTLVDGSPNPDAMRLDASAVRHRRDNGDGRDGRRGRGSGERRLATPSRLDTVEMLAEHDLLPAIFFIFSRAQCDQAARECVLAGLNFSDDVGRARVKEIAADRLDGLLEADLAVLGYEQFMAQLDIGVAAHHAGMVPPFKEVVERCFIEGLIKVVFATETLAVGVNMPARSVVIEKLTRFTGDHHEALTPGQFTQLTGRAGRRGIDELGTAIVLWSPFVRFDQVAELATSRSFQLRSAFRPTYNMAANLVRTYDAATARQLLTLSFAQFQADRDVVRIERRLQRQRERLAALEAAAASPFGDIEAFRALSDRGRGPHVRDDRVDLAMRSLRPGDVIHVTKGKHHGPVAVVATAHRKGGMRLTTITPSGHLLQLAGEDLPVPPVPIGSVVLPGSYSPNRKDYRSEVGKRIRSVKLRPTGNSAKRSRRGTADPLDDVVAGGLHPVEADPDLKVRLKAAADADRVRRDVIHLERSVQQRNSTLAAEFESVLDLLVGRGMLDAAAWSLTESGEMLARLFHESDLLIAEALRNGLLDGVDAPTLAGLVSTFVYEHRSSDEPPAPWFPNDDVRRRWESIERLSAQLATEEVARGLGQHRAPEPTFFSIAYAWVAGEGFATVVEDDDLTGGDFVRTVKQLIDLLGQIANVAPQAATRRTARLAADEAARGVVADSSGAPNP